MSTDTIIGIIIGGGLAAIVHYVNMFVLAYRIQRLQREVAAMVVAYAIKQIDHE